MPNLYVTEPGARVEVEAGRLVVIKDDAVLIAIPAVQVDQVVIVGGVGITTPALGFLLDRHIGLVLLTVGGAYRGRLSPDRTKYVQLRREQYRRADDGTFCLTLAKAFVGGKVRNGRTLCLRLDGANNDPRLLGVAADLHTLVQQLPAAPDLAAVLAIEGQAGRRYFAGLRAHLRPPWTFPRRARRPPPDPVNALFSLAYTLLHESCYSALEAAGLDPLCGYFHQPAYGRASLASDLMEEFRSVIADSVVLTLLNKQILKSADFGPAPDGRGVHLSHEGWQHVAEQYVRRLQTKVRPPERRGAISYQKVLELQAHKLRHVIEGECAAYEPFLAK